MARIAGFERPILHGLCTYGHAARAIVQRVCGGDPRRLHSLTARFTGIVFPGDTLTTRGWQLAPDRYAISVVTQRGTTVIDNSVATVDA
jgi:acyl dehydratase